jgi:hypothetical protein
MMRMEDQFDAVLYLGPASTMTNVTVPAEWCQDADFVARHLQRLTRSGPKAEVEHF